MSVNKVNADGSTTRLAGGTLYADMPIGTIVPYGGSNAPSGYLTCDGSAISRAEYAELFKAIGTAFGSGNGSTTFNLPDLRETVPVGTGTRGSGVASHDTYEVGTFKDDRLQNITGSIGTIQTASGNGLADWVETGALRTDSRNSPGTITRTGIVTTGSATTNSAPVSTGLNFDASRSARTGATTHGKQLGVNYIIKSKQVGVPQDILDSVEDMLADMTDVIPSNASASNQLVTKSEITIHTKEITNVTTNQNSNVNLDLPITSTVLSVLVTDEYPSLRAIAWYDPESHVWFAHVTDNKSNLKSGEPVSLVVRYI